MSTDPPVTYVIEPLDPARHDRAGFNSGVAQVDNFLKRTANKLTRADNLRTYVLTGPRGELIGFYALNAHAVAYTDLPERFARTRPGHGVIPAAYVAMIGVDTRFQGRGFGGDLLVNALHRLARAADVIGIAVVLLDVLDDGDPQRVARRCALYKSYGFAPLPSRPNRLFMPMATIRRLFQPTASGGTGD